MGKSFYLSISHKAMASAIPKAITSLLNSHHIMTTATGEAAFLKPFLPSKLSYLKLLRKVERWTTFICTILYTKIYAVYSFAG